MSFSNAATIDTPFSFIALSRVIPLFLFFSVLFVPLYSQTRLSQPDPDTLIVEDAPEMEVFAFGKTVIVKNQAKGVLALGGDVIIEGKVTGEVATIGGSVIQKKEGFIGGDVIIFGGSYKPELKVPLRTEGRETVIYAGYEEELRNLARNPSQIFAPEFSVTFFVQRLLSLLFWFGISLVASYLAPGAVSRAVARVKLYPLKIFGIGALGLVVVSAGVMISFGLIPGSVSGIIGLMAFAVIMLAYVFGRVTLQVWTGKMIVGRFYRERNPSETLCLLTGAATWTLLLSIPYLWTAALFVLFTSSIGLVLTARAKEKEWNPA